MSTPAATPDALRGESGTASQPSRSERRWTEASWFAWSLWGAAMALSGVALTLLIVTRSTATPPAWGFRGYAILFEVTFSTVGALIASRRPGNLVGWLFCAEGIMSGLESLAPEYALYALMARPGSLPGGELMAWLNEWTWVLSVGLLASLGLLLFPDGRLPSRRWGPLVWAIVGGTVLAALVPALVPGPFRQFAPIENPFGVPALERLRPLLGLGFLPMEVGLLGSAASLVVRFRRSVGDERPQIKWLAYAGALFAVAVAVNQTEIQLRGGSGVNSDTDVLVILATMTIPVAIGVAILKYRLYDIDLVINRTLVYGPLSGILAGVYIAATGFFQRLFIATTGRKSETVTVLTTLTIVALFTPVKNRLQLVVDRRFKEAPDPTKRLRGYGEQLRGLVQLVDLEQSTHRLLDEASTAFGAAGGAVFLERMGRLERVHTKGNWMEDAQVSVPLEHEGVRLGVLALGPRRTRAGYSAQDRETLQGIADLAARAVSWTARGRQVAEELPSGRGDGGARRPAS